MRRPSCTIDASCIIGLDYLDLVPQLGWLFSRVLIPRAVRTELFRRRKTKDRVRAIIRDYTFVEACDDYDKAAIDLLLSQRVTLGVRDRGEVEAVVQASQIGTMVIIDDRWGRSLAALHGRDVHGTLWVLRRLLELGLASAPVTRDRLVELLHRGIRLPRKEVNALLAEIGEPPIVKTRGT